MRREATGHYEVTSTVGETVRAFVPAPLPPDPPVVLSGPLQDLHERALLACGRLDGVSSLLPDPELFLYTQTAELGLHGELDDPAQHLMGKLAAEQVEAAIAALPDEYRVAATLYFIQDFSYQEIAEVIGVPVGTIRSRLHRGRRLLQKALWVIAEERGIVSALTEGTDDGE